MKTIGLIGGMSWESTIEYYRILNEEVNKRLGGWHSAKLILYSVDFDEIVNLQKRGEWRMMGDILADVAKRLERAGADFIVICTNTMHKVAEYVRSRIKIPLLSIIDCVANEIKKKGLKKVGLLGTKFTVEDDFYREGLRKHGIDVVIPKESEIRDIHKIIFDELCKGIFRDSSKYRLIEIIRNLEKRGAEGVILGCTELPLLIKEDDVDIPIFDSTKIHALYAVEMALINC